VEFLAAEISAADAVSTGQEKDSFREEVSAEQAIWAEWSVLLELENDSKYQLRVAAVLFVADCQRDWSDLGLEIFEGHPVVLEVPSRVLPIAN
jgi:hypothetical protein